ncbi:hypothetical protein [Streptomyces corynorhini]|uniref:hypothetical protein n=1 Tax=Streptomyces corynorhini TaxID=2282652 RepID=UPI0011C04D3B|nr:hypothetical protein [Streptomyces corynorhini]
MASQEHGPAPSPGLGPDVASATGRAPGLVPGSGEHLKRASNRDGTWSLTYNGFADCPRRLI